MKNIKKLLSFILILSFAFVLFSCDGNESKFPFADMIERPSDIPPLADLDYVKYPEKPANMSAGQGSGMPTIGTATTDSEYYKIEQNDGKITIRFNEVGKWDYIYLPISNFNKEYQNIKITATGTNVQKISFTALYYEMYDAGNPAVTTLIHDVGDTEQYYIMELGKKKLLDASYYTLDENLGEQTVFALCIFIDSNPSQGVVNKKTDIESVFEITKVEFLKDGDEAIKEVYVDPSFNVGYCDPGYEVIKDDATKTYTINKYAEANQWESGELSVSNYSSAYTAFNMKFSTTNVTNLKVELAVSGGLAEWAPTVLVYEAMLTDGDHEVYVDFSAVQPVNMTTWETVPGYYIKNYRITGIKFFIDTAYDNPEDLINEDATCVINELAFERVVVEGTSITKAWNTSSSNITIGDDLMVGGIGTVTYNWYDSWDYLSIPVANYQTAEKLVVEFQASEEIGYLGIALGSPMFPIGEAVIKSCNDAALDEAEKYGDVEGVVESIEYDSTTNIYKITFDFSNAASISKYDDKTVNEMPITSLRFYFTDPYGDDMFEGTRSIRFISISFE